MTESSRHWTVRAAERAIRWAIVAVFGEGFRQRNPGAIANAVPALALTYLPDAAEEWWDVKFEPWQRLYAGMAMLAHAVGMLGPYDDTWWWDHLTHFLSATILGGVVHVVADRRDREECDPRAAVLAVVGVGGLLWELLEYVIHAACRRLGIDPLLVTYSKRDTVLDLVFNLVGALLVVAFGDRLLGNFTRREE